MMVLELVDAKKYQEKIKHYKYFYNSMEFHELNKEKVQEVVYMLFKAKKYKMGIAGGISDGILKFPYSAPFAMFEFLNKDVRLNDIYESVQLLNQYAITRHLKSVVFRLPPSFYDDTYISQVQNALLNQGYQIEICDLNYQYILQDKSTFEQQLRRNARKNLAVAYKQNYHFIHCEIEQERKRAYDVIAENRKIKGYPLRMTYEQVASTIQYTNADFFIARLDEVDVAAAVVFQVNEQVYQVIYWGDIGGYSDRKPMNYVSAKVYEYYAERKIKVLDIGPSTEDGVPNFGLCDFKEGIGCDSSAKFTLRKKIV